ncbi:ComEA family DNA-binding protein [Actinoallomurus rhizosphaericola]|uniref:ComEA family DNA-binding protein n=1 Tax=Actinoallomurus rhizosphaericola TaxID=2952536 RepID=UPI002090D417|nr:helix-hairpin-helix domain-containing protein [Actinoallomurus rhizosphaericola]MCO5994612.1 helix-hairpin-helix domain-containing protein [Actinoallomurus rhizosphaericola]
MTRSPMPPPGRRPSQLPPRPPSDGLGWSVVPLITLGVGSPVSFLYAAVRRRSAGLAVAAAVYAGALVAAYEALLAPGDEPHTLGLLLLLGTWIVSAMHAIGARPRLYPPADPSDQRNRRVVEAARYRRTLREEARRIALEDRGLAHELRIGRPDLGARAYDDGGLIDVNHAPPQALALLPGVTPELVDRIVRCRAEHGGFISAEELAIQADLPPRIVPDIAEYGLFLT